MLEGGGSDGTAAAAVVVVVLPACNKLPNGSEYTHTSQIPHLKIKFVEQYIYGTGCSIGLLVSGVI